MNIENMFTVRLYQIEQSEFKAIVIRDDETETIVARIYFSHRLCFWFNVVYSLSVCALRSCCFNLKMFRKQCIYLYVNERGKQIATILLRLKWGLCSFFVMLLRVKVTNLMDYLLFVIVVKFSISQFAL